MSSNGDSGTGQGPAQASSWMLKRVGAVWKGCARTRFELQVVNEGVRSTKATVDG